MATASEEKPQKKQKTDAQKSVDGNFVKAKGLKTRLDTVQSKYLTLKEAVDTDAGWDWAKSRSLQDPIARARAKVEAVKKISAFWKEWSISSSVQFASAVKKSSTPKQMEAEFKHMPTLDKDITETASHGYVLCMSSST